MRDQNSTGDEERVQVILDAWDACDDRYPELCSQIGVIHVTPELAYFGR